MYYNTPTYPTPLCWMGKCTHDIFHIHAYVHVILCTDKPATLAESSVLNHVLRSKLVNSKHNVEIQRSDPNSPLYSVKSFEELRLHPNLLKGVYGMGFNKPSRIQELALPVLLAKPYVTRMHTYQGMMKVD